MCISTQKMIENFLRIPHKTINKITLKMLILLTYYDHWHVFDLNFLFEGKGGVGVDFLEEENRRTNFDV